MVVSIVTAGALTLNLLFRVPGIGSASEMRNTCIIDTRSICISRWLKFDIISLLFSNWSYSLATKTSRYLISLKTVSHPCLYVLTVTYALKCVNSNDFYEKVTWDRNLSPIRTVRRRKNSWKKPVETWKNLHWVYDHPFVDLAPWKRLNRTRQAYLVLVMWMKAML